MKITKEWLADQTDLYLTELAVLLMREKARREQPLERLDRKKKAKAAKVTV